MHRDLGKLEKGHKENLTRAHKAKCRVLHLARGDPRVPDSSRPGETFISLSLVLPPWPLPAPPEAALAGPWAFPVPLPTSSRAGPRGARPARVVPLPHSPCGQRVRPPWLGCRGECPCSRKCWKEPRAEESLPCWHWFFRALKYSRAGVA